MEFSILMPVYKAEKYLQESVDSILNQNFSDYELILAEDGSPDESSVLCDRLAATYPDRIQTLHFPHRGTIPTRRDAIAAARGDFILWLDSDDLMEPGTLQALHDLRIEANDPDIIIYEFTAFYEDGRQEDRRPPLFKDGSFFEGEETKKSLYELYIRGNQLDALWAKAVRRELFQEDPSDYGPCESNPYGEDALHGLYPLTMARKIYYSSRAFTRYRIRSGSVMHVFDTERLDQRFNREKLCFFRPFMERWGLWDREHRTLLKASAYRGVLDGILYFMLEDGYDQAAVKAYAKEFVSSHPDIKKLSRSAVLPPKQRIIFALFAGGHFKTLCSLIRLKRKLSSN